MYTHAEISTEPLPKDATDEQKAKQLPDPSGYMLLVGLPTIDEKTAGGVYRPDQLRDQEQVASIVGFVMKMGPDAYSDKKRFPSDPWCKKGDFVLFKSYTGIRFEMHGQEFRLISDDSVFGVVEDPRALSSIRRL
ncbi:MAG TPA: co-chaperone GroES [Candidatus Heimdallarchaeota archaeon]|nr:co-chaperone GroES [Candidatus Heimdallarchaeota archaeon]